MGNVQIYSRHDQEAHEGLQAYRISIGLPAVAEFQLPPKTQQIGEWVDGLAYEHLGKPWDVFVTATFRPMIRRWSNGRGFAELETCVARGDGSPRSLGLRDYGERLASHSPSQDYVQRFFGDWTERLAQGLKCRLDFFVGFEAGRVSGANHFHALLAADTPPGTAEESRLQLFRRYRQAGKSVREFARNKDLLLWGYLYRTAGRSLILPFDPGRGAGWYIAAAYVGKKQLGWDISIGDQALRKSAPAKGGIIDRTKSAELTRDLYHMTHTRWHR